MLLRIESTGRHTHHKQVKVIVYYIEKESWRLQSQRGYVKVTLREILVKKTRVFHFPLTIYHERPHYTNEFIINSFYQQFISI
jgi:hypothetical protein